MIHDKILHIHKINNEFSKSNITFITSQTKSAHIHVYFVLLLFVCIFAYAHVYFKTVCECIIKFIPIGPRSIAGMPLSQTAPAYLITAHHLCAFLLYLACQLCGGFQQKKTKKHTTGSWRIRVPFLHPWAGLLDVTFFKTTKNNRVLAISLRKRKDTKGGLTKKKNGIEQRPHTKHITNDPISNLSTLPTHSYSPKHGTQNNSNFNKHGSTLPLTTLSHT